MKDLRLLEAEKIRKQLAADQLQQIRSMYQNISISVEQEIKKLQGMENISSSIQLGYLTNVQKDVKKQLDNIKVQLGTSIPDSMYATAEAVVKDNNSFLSSVGLAIKGAYSHIPEQIVNNVITGQLYGNDWSLSRALWSQTNKAKSDINTIVAQGIAQNKPIYDIAKDLEKYVNPTAVKPWDWSKMYPGVNKVVDYNAQRLANTMVSHAYQQSFVATTKDNPFFGGYKWLNSNSHRGVCEVCRERAETDQYGLGEGIFPKDQLPIDHPNGVCTFSIVMTKDFDGVVDDLANWYHSPEGTYPDIDNFMDSFTKKSSISTVNDFVAVYGKSKKTTKSWLNDIPKAQKAQAKILKQQSGLTWEQWYEKYIYNGDGANLAKAKANAAKFKAPKFSAEAWLQQLQQNDMDEMEEWCQDWLQHITFDERRAIKLYTGSSYSEINRYLRGLSNYTSYEEQIGFAKSALNKASLPKETIVRRGSNADSLRGILGTEDLSQAMKNKSSFIGSIVEDKGFMSTSPAEEGGFNRDIEYIIQVPKGYQAMYVDPISEFPGERELILQAGTRFVIEDLETGLDFFGEERIKKVFLRVLA